MKLNMEPILLDGEVESLLASAGLPVSDLAGRPQLRLFGARADGRLIGVVGIELYAPVGLLRSLAVDAGFRQAGQGRALAAHAENQAAGEGVTDLYLLTTTAADFFARMGYATVPRDAAPEAIARTTQFAGLCPASSAIMAKRLAKT